MYSQGSKIFKPTLKTHLLLNQPVIKRFAFPQTSVNQAQPHHLSHQQSYQNQSFSYPELEKDTLSSPNYLNKTQIPSAYQQPLYQELFPQKEATLSNLTAAKFDPILPKFVFKRFLSDSQIPLYQPKRLNNHIIQPLKKRNLDYPLEVKKLFKQAQDRKVQYYKNVASQLNLKENSKNPVLETENSYRQSLNQHSIKGLRKIPYFPLIGTNGTLFWSHSVDKIILWRYRNLQLYNADVFCIIDFKKEVAPISAVYATQIRSSIFRNQRVILIAIAFFDQLHFFKFNIEKYEKQFVARQQTIQRKEEDFTKYLEKILVKINSNFLIQKILVQNIPSNSFPEQDDTRPLIIFTDGANDLQIFDLKTGSSFKSYNNYDPFLKRKKLKQNKNQNQIIKLLHCKENLMHYVFILKKQTSERQIEPNNLFQKLRNLISFTKQYEKKQQLIVSIYQWNQLDLKNDTIWKKIWNPPRLKKIKQITSRDLQNKLKQNFFEFFRINSNSQFLIADISLTSKENKSSIFEKQKKESCLLKITFINGASVFITNFKTFTFLPQIMVNPYIQKHMPISSCQYQSYRKLLDKAKFLQTSAEIKNKFNFYIYEPVDIQKEPKYSLIDPVVSQCNGLTICENKIIYEDEIQILYQFCESGPRKRIHQLNAGLSIQKQKKFMIFENSFIQILQIPKIAENLLLLGYFFIKYPQNKKKIEDYADSLIQDFSEDNKIDFIVSIIDLLIEIESSGKVRSRDMQSHQILDSLIRRFHSPQNHFDSEKMTYFDQKHSSKKSQMIYAYEWILNKTDYENFVQWFFEPEIYHKQKQQLKSLSSSYNGKTFKINLTEKTLQFLWQILVGQGNKIVSQKPLIKPVKYIGSVNRSIFKYLEESSSNQNDEKYLISLFEGMNQVHESFLTSAISQFIVNLIRPILNICYKDFNRIKSHTVKILQKMQQFKDFIENFIVYSSFKNNKSFIFSETILFCQSIQNSLPKISLILKLFQTLSEADFYNPLFPLNQKGDYRYQINLKNLLFKLNTKQELSRLTVSNLFQENFLLLDQIQTKIPQLNQIKNLRFFTGWRKINSKIIQNQLNQEPSKVSRSNQNDFTWIGIDKKDFSYSKINKINLMQKQFQKVQDIKERQQKDFFLIQKSLDGFSYCDFENYFINKGQFVDFGQILLQKIQYLQSNYLDLKNKYYFDKDLNQNFRFFAEKTQEKNQKTENQTQFVQLGLNKKKNGVPTFSSFLKYEEKVENYQRYLKTYQLIKYLNIQTLQYAKKVLDIYKANVQKFSIQMLPQTFTDSNHMPLGKSSMILNNLNQKHLSSLQSIVRQTHYLMNLLFQKGSDYMQNQLRSYLKAFPSFLPKEKNRYALYLSKPSEIQDLSDKALCIKGKQVKRTNQERQLLKPEQARRNMYQQKIQEKISTEMRSCYHFHEQSNWMKSHNQKSSSLFINKKH